MALSDGGNQGEGRTEEGGVPVVQDNAGQPGVRPTQRKGGSGDGAQCPGGTGQR